MPRDSNGSATRLTPPGSGGYVSGTIISDVIVDSEIDDIYNELTNSLDKGGRTKVTADIDFNGHTTKNLSAAASNGQAVRYQHLTRGTDINITANGNITLPGEGSYFVVTSSGNFNITGFNTVYSGRSAVVELPAGQNLINSATFLLKDGASRRTSASETVMFINKTAGTWEEVSPQGVVDLTGWAGADISLGIGQIAKYTLSSVSSLALRIATLTDQGYEVEIMLNHAAGSALASQPIWQINNAALGASSCVNLITTISNAGGSGGLQTNDPNFVLGSSAKGYWYSLKAYTSTAGKMVIGQFRQDNASSFFNAMVSGICTNTSTVWTSLGTLNFQETVSGTVTVRRLF